MGAAAATDAQEVGPAGGREGVGASISERQHP